MGFGNFLKRKSGAYKLPESRLNKTEVLTILQRNMPFIVTLPILETVRTGKGHATTFSIGGVRETHYYPAERKKVFRTIKTNINCEPTRIRIQHAKQNGEHMFVKYSDISVVAKLTNGKMNNGVGIELQNGKQFKFVLGKEHIKAWKGLGFNPEFPIDVFYNFLLGEWQTAFISDSQNTSLKHEFNPESNKSKTTSSKKSKRKKRKLKLDNWVICHNCGKKFKVSATKCPHCGTLNDSTKNKTLLEIAKENVKICPKCGYENSGDLTECWKCGSALPESFSAKDSSKTSKNKWKVCQNCGENVEFTYSSCPYCNSSSLKVIESMDKLPHFSPLSDIENDDGVWWKICPRCGKKVNKKVFQCPFCRNIVFEDKKSDLTDSSEETTEENNERSFFKGIFR
ncbi:hypothetical protein [Methanobrevibacter sp.]|uniref:hypothetical protein n=1 Tax=Methanobrevibacter sp. TaxID=66852 RepID=UPI00388FA483